MKAYWWLVVVGTADLIAAFNDGRRLKRGAPSLSSPSPPSLALPPSCPSPPPSFLLLLRHLPFSATKPCCGRVSVSRVSITDVLKSGEVWCSRPTLHTLSSPPPPSPPPPPPPPLLPCSSPTLNSSVIVMSGGLDSSLSSVDVSISTPTTLCPHHSPTSPPAPI